jgi:Helix-turn-helix of DDE superfamily endonuclease
MMKVDNFLRLKGVKREAYARMVEILSACDAKLKVRGGRKSKLCVSDRLDMALSYLRENRTYFHIANSYGISESNCYKIVRFVESSLVSHPDFALPGKRELERSDMTYDIVMIDVSETPIQRPKKNSGDIIVEKRSDTPSKLK